MNRHSSIWRSFAARAFAVGLGACGLVSNALAGCGLSSWVNEPTTLQDMTPAGGLMPAFFGREAADSFVSPTTTNETPVSWACGVSRSSPMEPPTRPTSPSALWSISERSNGTATGPGSSISGGKAPSTGDVCMGVWEQTGHRTYKLKHIGLAYASSDTPAAQGGPVVPAAFVGPGLIRPGRHRERLGQDLRRHVHDRPVRQRRGDLAAAHRWEGRGDARDC